jgi:cysteine desulfurase
MGLVKALEISQGEKEAESKRLLKLRDRLISGLQAHIGNVFLNGHPTKRLPNNINLSFAGIEGEAILLHLNERGNHGQYRFGLRSSHSLEVSQSLRRLVWRRSYSRSIRFTLGGVIPIGIFPGNNKIVPAVVAQLQSDFPPLGE